MERTDLLDVTFLIPVRLDSIVRLENLIMVVDFLSNHFKTNIHVLEASAYNNSLLTKLLPKEVSVAWQEDFDPIFYRTHYINIMVKNCLTPYIAIWDADVIVPNVQIIDAINLLRNEEADFVNPFNKFLDTSNIIRELYFITRDYNTLKQNRKKMKSLYDNPAPVGGAFIVKRDAYMTSGCENKNFYGWGVEDGERVNRWIILGYTYKRIKGMLYHLTHDRGKNSRFHTEEQRISKNRELYRICSMSKEQLKKEIKSWD